MSQALYRKYRPKSFADLIGQNPIRITLQNELENNRIAHAYLFSGPRGVGKTTTARLFAKAVNCQQLKGSEACQKCDFCQEISQGKTLDVIEIDAASHTGVDNVRENIIENSRFTPQRLKYKVFIIDEVHMLSISAFNALLKTLEEPPEHVIFILATTEIHRVPETIISRCQRFDFKRVGVSDLIKRINHVASEEDVTIEDSLVEKIAIRADGSVRDAEVLLSQLLALGEKNINEENAILVIPKSNNKLILEFFTYLIQNNRQAAIEHINNLIDEGIAIQVFTKDLIEFIRKVIIFKVSNQQNELSDLSFDAEEIKQISNLVSSTKINQLVYIIDRIIARSNELKYTQIIQLPLELAVLEICADDERLASLPKKDINQKTNAKEISNPKVEIKKVKEVVKKEKKIIKSSSNPQSAKLEKIKEDWDKILIKLKKFNHSISLVLKVGVPISVIDNEITIGFQYKFHAERLNEQKVHSIVEEVLAEMYGGKYIVKSKILSADEFNQYINGIEKNTDQENIFDQALEAFGGEIVEDSSN